MRRFSFITLALSLSTAMLLAQTQSSPVPAPVVKDFSGTLSFLSSDWMEGREIGTRGSFLAADFIATMMELHGLTPYGDPDLFDNPEGAMTFHQTYFQNFKVIRYQAEKATLTFIQRLTDSESALQLSPGIDFIWKSVPNSIEAEAAMVFAGYGLAAPDKGYNDYSGLDVNGRIVVVMDGYPGHADTTSPAWKKLGKTFGEDCASIEVKRRMAEKLGAVALIVIAPDDSLRPYSPIQRNLDTVNAAVNSPEITEPVYVDADYALPGDTAIIKIPCFILGTNASGMLFDETGIVLADIETRIADLLSPASTVIHGKRMRFTVVVKSESLVVRNVLGIIRGKDSTKSVVVGAHYDHLGVRNGYIYNGADDDASGVSGMLALAKAWCEYDKQPAFNIIFAAWTAEEKGFLGSRYYVMHSNANPDKLLLNINLDMISRSAPEDTASRQLSIGTMPGSDELRQIARASNLRLPHPFELDLWDVTGHFGSDYSSFTVRNVPVMTFFSGFHDDYHSPRDIAAKANLQKMENILKIVNECIWEFTLKSTDK